MHNYEIEGAYMIEIHNKSDSKEFHEYNEKLKCEKRTLHCRYISCICIGICTWLIITSTYNQSVFVEQFSMASTITSIILSVIAIIMSITGEGKTEGIRNQMTETTQELRNTVNTVQEINNGVGESLRELQKGLNELQFKIDQIPDSTAEKLYAKRRTSTSIARKVSVSSEKNKEWSNINDKQI